MHQANSSHLRSMCEDDLERVLCWRNHPKIRQYMYSQHEISLEEHSRWFLQASRDTSRHLLIFEMDAIPVGFVNIYPVAPDGIADWGFYAAPDAPRGTGRALGRATLCYAFETKGLHKICGQALAHNSRSIRFHLGFGFQREGVLREQHYDGRRYHDVVCFGLLANEWHNKN